MTLEEILRQQQEAQKEQQHLLKLYDLLSMRPIIIDGEIIESNSLILM